MTSMAAFLAPNPYFDKRAGLAIGIVSAGSGIGQLAVTAILRTLFDSFGFSGALLIYGK